MEFVEHERIPFTAEPLLGERLLVLAPHPDDDVIGCGGLIALHAREGRKIRAVVVTDGTASAEGKDPAGLAARRRDETNRGLAILGAPEAEFLGIPDRGLDRETEQVKRLVRERILDFRPDILVLPGPTEIHPDHEALGRAVVEMIQQSLDLAGALARCRIAFMEISRPITPNLLLDITDVEEMKQRAIAAHQSQHEKRDYGWYARGLNQYRSMTLGTESRYAEAFYVTSAEWIRTHAISELARALNAGGGPAEAADELPVTVIVRTRNRPNLLADALRSIRSSSSGAAIVVVNDGEDAVDSATAGFEAIDVVKGPGRGRSAAMNEGVRNARTDWIAFLDDDDLYYPEHLPALMRAARASDARTFYTDAVSVRYAISGSGTLEPRGRLRTYARDWDRDLLLFDNYIPLPTLLLRREDYETAGGFDPKFDLFEDWDFLIRLSALGPLQRVPKVTCEIRHIEGAGSAMLGNPAGSPGYEAAKLAVWKKHRTLADERRVIAAFESMKSRVDSSANRLQEEIGRAGHLEGDVDRLEREKTALIAALQRLGSEQAAMTGRLVELEHERGNLVAARASLAAELTEVHADRGRLDARNRELEGALQRSAETSADLYREIARLNALLDEIYGTRAWRLHQALERIRRK